MRASCFLLWAWNLLLNLYVGLTQKVSCRCGISVSFYKLDQLAICSELEGVLWVYFCKMNDHNVLCETRRFKENIPAISQVLLCCFFFCHCFFIFLCLHVLRSIAWRQDEPESPIGRFPHSIPVPSCPREQVCTS